MRLAEVAERSFARHETFIPATSGSARPTPMFRMTAGSSAAPTPHRLHGTLFARV